MTYTRNDMASDLSRRLHISENSARRAVNEFVSCIVDALKDGKRVEFRKFASMEVRRRKQKIGRNPKRPEDGDLVIPARRFVRFRTAACFEAVLNK